MDQVWGGLESGGYKLFVAGIGYLFFAFGKFMATQDPDASETAEWKESKWKVILVVVGIAVFLGALASQDHVIMSGGDYLYDGGEVEEVIANPEPLKRAVAMGVFSVVPMAMGAMKGKNQQDRLSRREGR